MQSIVCTIKKVLIKNDLEQRAAELCRTGYAIKCCVTCKPLKFIFDINSSSTSKDNILYIWRNIHFKDIKNIWPEITNRCNCFGPVNMIIVKELPVTCECKLSPTDKYTRKGRTSCSSACRRMQFSSQ